MTWRMLAAFATGLLLGALCPPLLEACPFCTAVTQTICERINTSDVAVLAELVDSPPPPASDAGTSISNESVEAAKSTFRVVKVYRGADYIHPGDTFKALYYGKTDPGVQCLAIGLEPKALQWGLPMELNARSLEYVERAVKLPATGPDRVAFFEEYLEAPEAALQEDAVSEFAAADYATLQQLHSRLNHQRLLKWIQNPGVPETRRRLYFVLLGICGDKKDAPMLKELIVSGDAEKMRGLDALLTCYLVLEGPDGLPLVEDRFLKKDAAHRVEFPDTYKAVMAIRFVGQQGDVIPRERIIASLRLMLDRSELADLVIPDLARWEDWDSIDRLVTLFKQSPKDQSYVREAVVNFLRACPRPEAKQQLEELAKLDPKAVRTASIYFPQASAAKTVSKAAKPEKKTKTAAVAVAKSQAATEDAPPVLANVGNASPKVEVKKAPAEGVATPAESKPPVELNTKGPKQNAAAAENDTPQRTAVVVTPPGGGRDVVASTRWFTACVLAAPPIAASLLILVLWLIIRLPRQNRVEEIS